MKPLDVHFTEYQRDGYTIFKQYLMPDRLTALRRQLDPIMEQRFKELPDLPRAVIPEALTHEMLGPLLIEQILNPVLLDFAELVMGPYVQLDSYRIAGFPIKPAPLHNQVDRWHRDAFNLTETWVNYASGWRYGFYPLRNASFWFGKHIKRVPLFYQHLSATFWLAPPR